MLWRVTGQPKAGADGPRAEPRGRGSGQRVGSEDGVQRTRTEDRGSRGQTLVEIQAGIEITREQDAAKAAESERWLARVAASTNVLVMDAATFRLWARLMHRRSDTPYEEATIAATAKAHDLTVVTHDVADFEPFGVRVLDPLGLSAGAG